MATPPYKTVSQRLSDLKSTPLPPQARCHPHAYAYDKRNTVAVCTKCGKACQLDPSCWEPADGSEN